MPGVPGSTWPPSGAPCAGMLLQRLGLQEGVCPAAGRPGGTTVRPSGAGTPGSAVPSGTRRDEGLRLGRGRPVPQLFTGRAARGLIRRGVHARARAADRRPSGPRPAAGRRAHRVAARPARRRPGRSGVACRWPRVIRIPAVRGLAGRGAGGPGRRARRPAGVARGRVWRPRGAVLGDVGDGRAGLGGGGGCQAGCRAPAVVRLSGRWPGFLAWDDGPPRRGRPPGFPPRAPPRPPARK
jgi:hypothetical protein